MPNEMTDNGYAQHLSNRLREVAEKLEGDDRSLLLLCSGYLAGQASRIKSLLGWKLPRTVAHSIAISEEIAKRLSETSVVLDGAGIPEVQDSLRIAADEMQRLATYARKLEDLVVEARDMGIIGDINPDMDDDGYGWKEWSTEVWQLLPPT